MKKAMKKIFAVIAVLVLTIVCIPAVPAKAGVTVSVIEIDPGMMEWGVGDAPLLTPTNHDANCQIAYMGWICEADKTACMSSDENNIINPYADYTPFEKFEAGKKYDLVLGAALDKSKGTFASDVKHVILTSAPVKVFEDENNYYAEMKLVSNMNPAGNENVEIKTQKNTITTKATITKKKSSKKQSFKLSVKCKSGDKNFTFKSNNKKVTVDKNGKVTIAKNFVGTAKITVKSPKSIGWDSVTKTIKIVVKK